MIIEAATPADAREILELQLLAYRSEAEIYGDDTIPPLMQSLEDIQEEFTSRHFLKATLDGRIIGSVRAFCENGTCFVGRLIVHPDHQGKGIGTQLMVTVEHRFCDATRLELFTGHKSERNIRLYERLGYSIFKTEQVSDSLIFVFMEKDRRTVTPHAPEAGSVTHSPAHRRSGCDISTERALKSMVTHVLKHADGRNEPIKDLDNATRLVLVDKDTVGAEDITFAYCRFEAKTSLHRKHVHEHAEEVIYILSGKGMSGIADTEVEMVKGDTMFVPRGAEHWFYNPFDEPVEMIFIYTRPSLKSAGYKVVQ